MRGHKLTALLRRHYASTSSGSGTQLVRDFIHDSLYNLEYGYFAKRAPVGALPAPIPFAALADQRAYLTEVQRVYTQLQTTWLTPAEIFTPHYGAAIAAYAAAEYDTSHRDYRHRPPLKMYEIGGGTGTLARDILDWLRQHRSDLYPHHCSYTILEISPQLAALQQQRLADAGHGPPVCTVGLGDAAEADSWGGTSLEPCTVVACEVLDNLPHDRVAREGAGSPWHQIEVMTSFRFAGRDGAEGYLEVARPVTDPRIRHCLDAYERLQEMGTTEPGLLSITSGLASLARKCMNVAAGEESVFLPTGALQLLRTLHAVRPNHSLFAADFDALPESVISGRFAPLVATTSGGKTVDHGTYLVPKGSADIFFPTDFDLLQLLYDGEGKEKHSKHVAHMKSGAFMAKYAPDGGSAAATRSGYNPLLQDYSNTSVLIARRA